MSHKRTRGRAQVVDRGGVGRVGSKEKCRTEAIRMGIPMWVGGPQIPWSEVGALLKSEGTQGRTTVAQL